MTVLERVNECKDCRELEKDSIDKLICLAYYIGREQATRELSDKYRKLLKEQRKRAKECRYHNMAAEIIGDTTYIYSPDYAMDMTAIFGSDETEV